MLEKGQVLRLKHKSLGNVDGSEVEKLLKQAASPASRDELSSLRENIKDKNEKQFKHLDESLAGIKKKN